MIMKLETPFTKALAGKILSGIMKRKLNISDPKVHLKELEVHTDEESGRYIVSFNGKLSIPSEDITRLLKDAI